MSTDLFLKLDKIPGESTQKGHEGEIDVHSLSYGVQSPSQIGQGGKGLSGGKASFSEISFTKSTDKASPNIFKAAGSGQHIATAVFSGQKAGGNAMVYFKISLTDVIVTSFQNSGSSGDSVLSESVSFGYSKIQFEYTEQDAKGAAAAKSQAGFDVVTGQSV